MLRSVLRSAMWAMPVAGALFAAFAGTGLAAAAAPLLDFRQSDALISRLDAGYSVQPAGQLVGRLDARIREQAAADDRMLTAYLERPVVAPAVETERGNSQSAEETVTVGPSAARERELDSGSSRQGARLRPDDDGSHGPEGALDGGALSSGDGSAAVAGAPAAGTASVEGVGTAVSAGSGAVVSTAGGGIAAVPVEAVAVAGSPSSGAGGSGGASAPADPGGTAGGGGGGGAPADPGAGGGGGGAPADPGAGGGGGGAPADPGAGGSGGGAPADPGAGGGGGGAPADPGAGGGGGGAPADPGSGGGGPAEGHGKPWVLVVARP